MQRPKAGRRELLQVVQLGPEACALQPCQHLDRVFSGRGCLGNREAIVVLGTPRDTVCREQLHDCKVGVGAGDEQCGVSPSTLLAVSTSAPAASIILMSSSIQKSIDILTVW
eukprot:4420798-Prymnesium_polylepis.1